MTTVLLIRHAHTDAVGVRLSGRRPGVALSAAGREEAERLAVALGSFPLAAIYTSPLERAVETAAAVARVNGAPVRLMSDAQEIDFGEWTGRTFSELQDDPAWRRFNQRRAISSIPGGEPLAGVQRRIVRAIQWARAEHRGATCAVVSHADVIRFALLHFIGASLDDYARFEVGPASVTAVSFLPGGARVRCLWNALTPSA